MKYLIVAISAALLFCISCPYRRHQLTDRRACLGCARHSGLFSISQQTEEGRSEGFGRILPRNITKRICDGCRRSGTIWLFGYLGYFIVPRGANATMEPYQPTLEPIDIDLKIDPQASFSPQSPQANVADGPFYSLDTPEARALAAKGTVSMNPITRMGYMDYGTLGEAITKPRPEEIGNMGGYQAIATALNKPE